MKKKFIPRKRKQTIAEMSWNAIAFEREPSWGFLTNYGGYMTQPRRIGKRLKRASFALMYGASLRKAQEVSGLSLRRIKTLDKALRTHAKTARAARTEFEEKFKEQVIGNWDWGRSHDTK